MIWLCKWLREDGKRDRKKEVGRVKREACEEMFSRRQKERNGESKETESSL